VKTARGELHVLDDAARCAAETAARFVQAAEAAIAARGRFFVSLAGGSTPKAAYQLLRMRKLDWEKIDVWFGDERCVPPDHKDSNFRMASEALLLHVPAKVHRIEGELQPEEAARHYAQALAEVPRFDLVLLGMGPDGHTASLFPGTPALAERKRRAVAVHVTHLTGAGPPVPGDSWRVTLSAPVLSLGREILIACPGADKAGALKSALEGPDGSVPIQLIRPSDGTQTWLCDRAAAARLVLS
jgi:6-phosphogluconolactonase